MNKTCMAGNAIIEAATWCITFMRQPIDTGRILGARRIGNCFNQSFTDPAPTRRRESE